MSNRPSLFRSTLMLTGVGLVSQVFGFLYRIVMARLVGAQVLGLYQLIMPAYSVVQSICISGLAVAVSLLSSEYHARKNELALRQLMSTGLRGLVALWLPVALTVLFQSDFIARRLLGDGRTQLGLVLLLPVLLPFFIGLAVSLLAEKPVRLLQTRAHVPRSLASGLCVLLLFGLLFGVLFFLCRLLCAEAADLARQLPQLAENLAPLFEKLKSRLLALAERLPDGLGTGLRAGVEEFFKTGAGFGTKLYETLFSWASGIIGRLPDAVLFAVTAILSSFMLSGELPAIRTWLRKLARPEWLEKLQRLGGHVRTTLGGWLRAQLKLMGITFLILNAGLLLLRVRYPVLAALIITVVDALPVFGTGTILIPWALVLFLRGQTKTGVGLVVLYGAAALSRQTLEPRLVGKQVGLNPVLTLLALYTGYRLLGVGGMIVFPITAMLLKQIWDHSGLQPEG